MFKKPVSMAGLILAAGLNATAQTAPIIVADDEDGDVRRLDQVVVQGTKLGLSVQDADVSVEVYDEIRIEREAIFDLDDALLRTPNIAINGNTSSLTIRGINRNGVSGGGQGVTSNVYIDGVPVATTGLTFGLESVWDVSQIEVLRGPQSTVQGRNALAGAIVVSTADPTYEWEGKARARYASFNTQQYAGALSGPIIEDQFAFRIAVDYQSTDGFIDNLGSATLDNVDPDDFTAFGGPNGPAVPSFLPVPGTGTLLEQDFQDAISIRSKLLFEPNFLPNLRTELTFEFVNTELGLVSPFVNAPGPAPSQGFAEFDPQDRITFGDFQSNDTDIYRGIIDLSYDVTDSIELVSLTTFEQVNRERVLGDPTFVLDFDTNGFNDDVIETYTQELAANFQFNRLSGRIGGYYFQSREDFVFDLVTQLVGLAPPGIVISPPETVLTANTDTLTRTENFAFYGNLRYELNDKWTFALGLRYDNERFDTTGLQADTSLSDPTCTASGPLVQGLVGVPIIPCTLAVALLGGGDGGDVDLAQSDTFDAFLPKGSITYNFTDDISTFFAVQRGYRAGGTFVQQTAVNGQPETIIGTFEPEFLTNFELGLRSQFFDQSLTVNGSVFFSILDDQQVSLPGPTGGVLDFFTDNVGESQIYGLELSLDYQPSDELNLYGSLGLLGSEFTEFPFAVNFPDSPFFDLEGNEPALAPNVTFTIGGSYNHKSGLFADASLNFTGSAEVGVENIRAEDLINPNTPIVGPIIVFDPATVAGLDETSDSRTVVNLRLGYRHDRFTLSAFATNLFDDSGFLNQNFATVLAENASLNLFETPNFTLQQPQTFGVQLDVNF